MGLLRDVLNDSKGMRFRYRVTHFFSPKDWLRLHKYRKQRADRGWSDMDTWDAGDHIVKITAEILQHLNDNKYTDWPEWFRLNIKDKEYKSLQQVIDDINQYLEFSETSWADGLDWYGRFMDDDGKYKVVWRYENSGRKLNEKQVSARVQKWIKEEKKSYLRAQKAMQFFGRHFASFWD